jgi:FkbM family methyltransferase
MLASMLRKTLLKVVRDNPTTNRVGRSLLRSCLDAAPSSSGLRWLTSRYRPWGRVDLDVGGARFAVYSESDDHIASELYFSRGHDSPEVALVQRTTRAGGRFIDVGANTGVYALLAAASSRGTEVVCIEPAPANFERLKTNAGLNPRLNVKLVNAAIGPRLGNMDFSVPLDGRISTVSSANRDFADQFGARGFRTISVPVRTLDDVLEGRKLQRSDLVKIDVETFELGVLEGAERTLEQGPTILIEIWSRQALTQFFPHLQMTVSEDHQAVVERLLVSYGYRPALLKPTGLAPVESITAHPNEVNYVFRQPEA